MMHNEVIDRLKSRFTRNLSDQDWDIPTEIDPPKSENTTINTALVSQETVMVCLTCGFRNHLKNNKCIKCDYLLP